MQQLLEGIEDHEIQKLKVQPGPTYMDLSRAIHHFQVDKDQLPPDLWPVQSTASKVGGAISIITRERVFDDAVKAYGGGVLTPGGELHAAFEFSHHIDLSNFREIKPAHLQQLQRIGSRFSYRLRDGEPRASFGRRISREEFRRMEGWDKSRFEEGPLVLEDLASSLVKVLNHLGLPTICVNGYQGPSGSMAKVYFHADRLHMMLDEYTERTSTGELFTRASTGQLVDDYQSAKNQERRAKLPAGYLAMITAELQSRLVPMVAALPKSELVHHWAAIHTAVSKGRGGFSGKFIPSLVRVAAPFVESYRSIESLRDWLGKTTHKGEDNFIRVFANRAELVCRIMERFDRGSFRPVWRASALNTNPFSGGKLG